MIKTTKERHKKGNRSVNATEHSVTGMSTKSMQIAPV